MICPNKSWPSWKEVVAKHGEAYAQQAFQYNGYKMFDSVAHAEQIILEKKEFEKRFTAKIKKNLLDVLKIQEAMYRKRAAGKKYAEDIREVIDELEKNNDLVGLVRMLELANGQSASVLNKMAELKRKYPSFDGLSQAEVADVAETLQEMKRFISTYNILQDLKIVFPAGAKEREVVSDLVDNNTLIIEQYKDMHEDILAAWLSSQVERVNKNLAAQGKQGYMFTKSRIKELLNTATADIGTWEKMLGAQASSKDPLTGLIAARIKEEAFKVNQENIDVESSLVSLYQATGGSNNPEEFNKRYMRDALNWEFIPQLDVEGKMVYDKEGKLQGEWKYVKRKAFVTEFDEDLWARDWREFSKTLPKADSEENIKKRMKLINEWRKENVVIRENPQEIIARKKKELSPLDFDRWIAENTRRVSKTYYSDGSTNMSYFNPAQIYSNTDNYFTVFKEVSDFYRPADKYRNKQFATLIKDPYYKKLYETYQTANNRVHESKRLKFGIIPQRRKTTGERYVNGNGRGFVENLKTSFENAVDVNAYDTAYGLQTPDKKDLKNIPIYFTELIDEVDLSFDLLESTLQYHAMAANYDSMSKIEPFIEMVYDAIQGNSVVKISPRNVQTLNAKGEVKVNPVTGAPLGAPSDAVNEALIEFLDKVIYGEYEIPSIMTVNDKQISKNKLANHLLKYTSLNGLAFNVNSFFNNTLLGNFTMAIESFANDKFGLGNLISAESTYFANVPGLMQDLSKGYPVSKLGKLMVKYDAIQGEHSDTYGNNLSGNALKRMFTTNSLFFLTKGPEHQIQGTGMIAMMLKQQVKYKNGTTSSLWEAYDENGNLKKDVLWTKEDQFNFMQKLHSLNKGMHGIYNKFDSPTLQRKWFGKLLLLFRKWIYTGFQRRWSGEYVDIESGEVVHGYYNKFFGDLWKDIQQGKFEMLFSGNLNDDQKKARAKALGEVGVMLSMLSLYFVFSGGEDDDENTWIENQMILQSRRLAGDFMFFTPINPFEWLRVVNNPSVALSQLTKMSKFAFQLADPLEKYERDEYPYSKGDYKIEKRFNDLLPIYGQMIRAVTPENQISEYKRAGF
jgi:hypothetical protein